LKTYEFTPIEIGNFFMIFPIAYVIFCFLIQLIPETVEKRVLNIVSIIGGAFALFLVGPSQLLHMPASWELMAVG